MVHSTKSKAHKCQRRKDVFFMNILNIYMFTYVFMCITYAFIHTYITIDYYVYVYIKKYRG